MFSLIKIEPFLKDQRYIIYFPFILMFGRIEQLCPIANNGGTALAFRSYPKN